jgi:hypothetical protein
MASVTTVKRIATWLLLGILLAVGVHLYYHVPLGWSMLAFLVGWPILGTIITADDDLPGGWSNPDGTRPPDWHYREFWGWLVLRTGVSFLGFASDVGISSAQGILFVALALIGSLVGATVIRSGGR